ncbi:MAG: hypothetical protein KC503_29160 [Myxococcales bacterium]|nr:hypothetical protein [Myxococcales bacterium]
MSQAGLDVIAQILPDAVPKTFPTPAVDEKLFGCSFLGETRIKIDPSTISLPLQEVSIKAGQGTLTVDAAGALSIAAKTRFRLCVGSLSCTGNVTVSRWTASASFDPSVAGAKIKLANARVQIDIPSSGTKVWFSGCGLPGAVLNGAISLFKKTIVNKARDALNKALADKVQPFLEQRLAEMTKLSRTFGAYKFTGQLSSLASGGDRVQAGATLDVDAVSKAPCAAGGPAATLPAAPAAVPAMSIGTDHLGLALSSRAISAGLGAARDSGLLCFDHAKLAEIGVDKTKLGIVTLLIGMKTLDSFSARAAASPTVTLAPSSGEARLSLSLPVEVELVGTGAKGPTTVTISSTVEADVALKLDSAKEAIVLAVSSLKLGQLSAKATDPFGLKLNLAPIKPAVDAMVQAAIGGQLSAIEVAPRAFSAASGPLSTFYLYLSRATSDAQWATLFGKLIKRAPGDKTPPLVAFKTSANTTSSERSAASNDDVDAPKAAPDNVLGTPVGGIVTINAKATDGDTPDDLLRYAFRVDGGEWSAATHSATLRTVLDDGTHTVEVRVTDLSGNVAPAKSLDVLVDTIGPDVSLLAPPSGRIDDPDALRSNIAVSDNTTPRDEIEIKIQLRHVDSGELVDDTPFAAKLEALPALRLPRTGDYELLVFARDRVGNLGQPARSTFSYHGPPSEPATAGAGGGGADDVGATQLVGGCALASAPAGAPSAALWIVLGLLALVVRRRR